MWFVSLLTAALAATTVVAPTDGGLRLLAEAAQTDLGAAVDLEALSDDGYRQLLIDNVTMLSTRADFSVASIQPEPGVFDFSRTDAIVDFAVEHGLKVRGNDLIDAEALPPWITSGSWTPETLSQVLTDHVTTVVTHYRDRNPGVITQWDVVSEAFLADGTPRPTTWQQVLGTDYMRIAFDAARAADPEATLFYSDFFDDLSVSQDAVATGTPVSPGATADLSSCGDIAKCQAVQSTVAGLLDAGTPIDGIGFKAHLFSPDPVDLAEFSTWATDLGLVWAVTEFDVPVPITEVTDATILEFQAVNYGDALAACTGSPSCDTFVTWGITDRFSPIPAETGGAFGGALWFDEQDQPKPAFDSLADGLASAEVETAPTTVPVTKESAPPTTDSPAAATTDGGGSSPVAPIIIGVAALAVCGAIVLALRRRGPKRT
ncbi:MAG: endo-1,4-beta-xylanase [Ilumatobacteraceae bacterium]